MYILAKNGDNTIKYSSYDMELTPDGVIVDGVMYDVTIDESSPDKFDLYVSSSDFGKIVLNSKQEKRQVKDISLPVVEENKILTYEEVIAIGWEDKRMEAILGMGNYKPSWLSKFYKETEALRMSMVNYGDNNIIQMALPYYNQLSNIEKFIKNFDVNKYGDDTVFFSSRKIFIAEHFMKNTEDTEYTIHITNFFKNEFGKLFNINNEYTMNMISKTFRGLGYPHKDIFISETEFKRSPIKGKPIESLVYEDIISIKDDYTRILTILGIIDYMEDDDKYKWLSEFWKELKSIKRLMYYNSFQNSDREIVNKALEFYYEYTYIEVMITEFTVINDKKIKLFSKEGIIFAKYYPITKDKFDVTITEEFLKIISDITKDKTINYLEKMISETFHNIGFKHTSLHTIKTISTTE